MPRASRQEGLNPGQVPHPAFAARCQHPYGEPRATFPLLLQIPAHTWASSSLLWHCNHMPPVILFTVSESPQEFLFILNSYNISIHDCFHHMIIKWENICNITGFLPLLIMGLAIRRTSIFNIEAKRLMITKWCSIFDVKPELKWTLSKPTLLADIRKKECI